MGRDGAAWHDRVEARRNGYDVGVTGIKTIQEREVSRVWQKEPGGEAKRAGRVNSLVPMATLAAAYAGAKPVIERLLYDDDLRDNIRTFVEAARSIADQLSGED